MPIAAMFLAVLLWASTIVGSKLAVTDLAVTGVVAARFAFAAAALWILVLILRRNFRLTRASRGPMVMGLLDPGLVSLLMVWGLAHTAALNAAVFWALMPILMPILGRIFLRESISLPTTIGAVLAFGGSILLVSTNAATGEGSLFGDFLSVCAILCACANALIARRVAQDRADPIVTTTYQLTISVALALFALLIIERPAASQLTMSSEDISLMAYLGIGATAGPFLLYNYALRHMQVGHTGLFASLVAPMAAPMAAILLGEEIVAAEFVAVAIVLTGVALPFVAESPRGRRLLARFTGRSAATGDLAASRETAGFAPKSLQDISNTPLRDLQYVVFDTETTGLRPSEGDEVVQVAAVRIVEGRVREDDAFNEMVNPQRPIPPLSTTFHGITDDMVLTKPTLVEVLPRFHAYCQGSVLVAHNAAFDLKFLSLKEAESGCRFDMPVLDTLLLSATLDKRQKDHRLASIVARLDIGDWDQHTALGDARVTADVFLRFIEMAEEQGVTTLGDAIKLSYKARRFRRLQKQF